MTAQRRHWTRLDNTPYLFPMLSLGILDQSPVRAGATPAEAIAETVELAQLADRLGYSRYWLAEHHSTPGLAGTAPEILVARIAAATETIRVGSGGVMLSHYSPLKVAETFRMLETLYPGRIDLGIGRAPGGDMLATRALQAGGSGAIGFERFPQQLADLVRLLGPDGLPAAHPLAGVRAMPEGPTAPETWLLGSSDQSAAFAAYFGCAFSFAHFITDVGGVETMRAYREHFRPSAQLPAPRGSVGVFALCAETEEAAERLATSRDLWRLRLDYGELGPVPSVEEALAYPYSEAERARIALHRRRQAVGTPEKVRDQLAGLAAAYGVDELIVLSICHDPAARRRSYELLADAFGLAPRRG
ncbi:MAG TPA: LLM class flavin-dependent oxidoreductase [Stellaceae bacterium]